MTVAVDAQELYPELHPAFHAGIVDGKNEAIAEARTAADEFGLRKPNYDDMHKPIEIGPLDSSVLGVTYTDKSGAVHGVRINMHIPYLAASIAKAHNKGREWAKKFVYNIAKLTAEHELFHVLTSYVAKGEDFNERTVDIMESLTTYGRHKVAKRLGKHKKAELIKETNPYPMAWTIGKLADLAPYISKLTGKQGYKAFLEDVQIEPFYKPMWRLAKASVKVATKKAVDYIKGTGVPSYVPTRA